VGWKYEWMKEGMPSRSVMSNGATETLSVPCFWARELSRSCLRPTAMIADPLMSSFSARAWPMPDVAPMTRTFL